MCTRKFRCPQTGCPPRIFTERLLDRVEPYARKTTHLHEVLELVQRVAATLTHARHAYASA
jgi:hypothetical protein